MLQYLPEILKKTSTHFFLLLFLLSFSNFVRAQNHSQIPSVGPHEFRQMNQGERGILFQEWSRLSYNVVLPESVEQEATQYYRENHIDLRIYNKMKILLQTVCNEKLPVSNRINACLFIIDNYSNGEFPVEMVRKISNELLAQTK